MAQESDAARRQCSACESDTTDTAAQGESQPPTRSQVRASLAQSSARHPALPDDGLGAEGVAGYLKPASTSSIASRAPACGNWQKVPPGTFSPDRLIRGPITTISVYKIRCRIHRKSIHRR